jgi:hypothetical protein
MLKRPIQLNARVRTEFNSRTLVVRIPMRFQRRGARKHIVASDGSQILRATSPSPTARF